ncbi:galectin-5-like [Salarias fasciatus]|uniref:Galectin n=1 Tax=Salarias fasciatus TaxID=181472 RepID=A0A672I4F3_SALFA|nr:galectin-5-like [Salarias fasciatus]
MSGFDLFDALDDSNSGSASGSNQSSGQGQPTSSAGIWPEGQSGGGGPWQGGGGPWGGNQSGGGGMWPGAGGGGSNPSPGGWPSPAPASGPGPAHGGGSTPASGPSPRQSLSVPYRLNLRNGVYDGLLFVIKGVIKPNANRITIDMCTKGDIAFHFNPRFNEGGQQVIVRNSCRNKKWDKEERELSGFPFVPGQPFEMEILCTSSDFKVSVNRSPLLTFRHRISDLRSISTLCIYYDLDLISVDQRTQ